MKRTILILCAGAALCVGFLTSCRGKMTISGDNGTDSIEFDTDSIRQVNLNMRMGDAESDEGGGADETELGGMAPYEEATFPIDQLPASAEEQDRQGGLVLYVNAEQTRSEDEPEGIYSVWMADERARTVRRILLTNPTAPGLWDDMKDKNAAPTAMHLIATAERALFATKDGSRIVVEGCPDGRNYWTYIVDTKRRTVKQLPSTEGVQSIDLNRGEILLASYGYYPAPDYGRYTVTHAYSTEGKFLRQVGEPEPE